MGPVIPDCRLWSFGNEGRLVLSETIEDRGSGVADKPDLILGEHTVVDANIIHQAPEADALVPGAVTEINVRAPGDYSNRCTAVYCDFFIPGIDGCASG